MASKGEQEITVMAALEHAKQCDGIFNRLAIRRIGRQPTRDLVYSASLELVDSNDRTEKVIHDRQSGVAQQCRVE